MNRRALPTLRPYTTAPPRIYKRPVYVRHTSLPKPKNTLRPFLLITAGTLLSWGGFLFYASNEEKSSSSVVKSAVFQMRNDPRCIDFLGDGIDIPPAFGFSEFRIINGKVNAVSGKVDVQFVVAGDKDVATTTYTAIRRRDNPSFEVLRWKLTKYNGDTLDLLED